MINDDLERQLSAYAIWMDQQPLARNTRRAYLLQVRQYGEYLSAKGLQNDDPLSDPFARDYAVRDYKTYVKTEAKAGSGSLEKDSPVYIIAMEKEKQASLMHHH